MKMSSRVSRAVQELRDALQLVLADRTKFHAVVRCYGEVLPSVSKKTAAIVHSGVFSRRVVHDDPAMLPVTTASLQRALRELSLDPRPDPEWLGTTAENVAETLAVHFIDDVCEECQYDLGTYVSSSGCLVLMCRTDTHFRHGDVTTKGTLDIGDPWDGTAQSLRPALVSDLDRAGVVLI